MSKLIEHIEAHKTGRIFPAPIGPILHSEMTSVEDVSFEPYPGLIEYSIRVQIGSAIRVDMTNPTELGCAIKDMELAIEQEVFGEFREDFDRISRALWQRDCDKAKVLLEEMRKKMFSA